MATVIREIEGTAQFADLGARRTFDLWKQSKVANGKPDIAGALTRCLGRTLIAAKIVNELALVRPLVPVGMPIADRLVLRAGLKWRPSALAIVAAAYPFDGIERGAAWTSRYRPVQRLPPLDAGHR
jgi:hypothetical protein